MDADGLDVVQIFSEQISLWIFLLKDLLHFSVTCRY